MQDLKTVLRVAEEEIQSLRRRNELLAAKVEMIDLFALVLNTQPARRSVGMSEDVTYQLRQHAEEIERKEKEKAKP